MKKYRVSVETTKYYEIEIDDEKLTEDDLKAFENYFHKLDEEDDKYKSMANDYCKLRSFLGDMFIEGYGYVLEKGEKPYSYIKDEDVNKTINLTKIDDDGIIYVDVEEI